MKLKRVFNNLPLLDKTMVTDMISIWNGKPTKKRGKMEDQTFSDVNLFFAAVHQSIVMKYERLSRVKHLLFDWAPKFNHPIF
jgi:hypothetical protein